MSDREKEMIEKIVEAILQMSEFDKGYILGRAEAITEKRREQPQSVKN